MIESREYIREYIGYLNDEHIAELRKEIEENGLYESINKRFYEIGIMEPDLSCLTQRIQKMQYEILYLMELIKAGEQSD